MASKTSYEYDPYDEVLIRIPPDASPNLISRNNLVWRTFGREHEEYARAIYFGQGCWECLRTLTIEQANALLAEWGYPIPEE